MASSTEAMHIELSKSLKDEIMFRVFTALQVVDTGCSCEEVMEVYNVIEGEPLGDEALKSVSKKIKKAK